MDDQQLPLGFGFALAMNHDAMDRYAKMTEAEKELTIARARNVTSKEEMESIVSSLAEGDESKFTELLDGQGIG